MLGKDYKWYITFEREGRPFILSEGHKDFKEVQNMKGMDLYSATLVKIKHLSKNTESDVGSVVHHLTFDHSKLIRIFRREECGLSNGASRVIPSLEILKNGTRKFIFAFPDKVFITENSRYYRKDWDYATD
tara:strand:- start:3007 stop:3399 length:393 start_codon:yes stop_codon:yes gene_type:complete